MRTYYRAIICALTFVSLASCSKKSYNAPAGGPEDPSSYQYSVVLHGSSVASTHAAWLAIIKPDASMKILSDNDSVVNFHTDEGNYGITLWAQKAGDGVRLRSKTTYVGTEMNEQQKKAAEWADKVASKLGFDPSKKETKAH